MSCTQLSSVRTKKSLAVMLENSHKTVHANVYKQCICKNIRRTQTCAQNVVASTLGTIKVISTNTKQMNTYACRYLHL